MYYYLYDSKLNDKKYTNIIARIETRLTDLGINGKINRLSFLKNINQVLAEEIKRGVKTIIIVGDDKTIGQVINLIADFNITIGIIPIGPNNNIARLLGLPSEESACDIISSRIIKKMDLGKINNYYFLTSLEIGGKNITLECDKNYIINLQENNNIINISNLNSCYDTISDPTDGKLDIFIENVQNRLFRKNRSTLSHLKNKTIRVTSDKTIPIFLSDERKIIKTPADVDIIPKKIKMIVGKRRYF
ncbi:MAG: diacylglycerol kinase family protein [Candidatus Buchananbacteria bacterium]|nr:diacylglycerol kinase family protein [Candidatus Buchananbacteria bacterium]